MVVIKPTSDALDQPTVMTQIREIAKINDENKVAIEQEFARLSPLVDKVSNLEDRTEDLEETVNGDAEKRIVGLVEQVENIDYHLTNDIDPQVEKITQAIKSIELKDGTVGTSFVMVTQKIDQKTPVTTELQMADENHNGFMPKESFNQIATNTRDIAILQGASLIYSITIVGEPTNANITSAFVTAHPTVTLEIGIRVADWNRDLQYACTNATSGSETWVQTNLIPVGTTTKIGGVKSSSTLGQITIENSGVMSLNGYDNIADATLDGSIRKDLDTTMQTVGNSTSGLVKDVDDLEASVINIKSDVTTIQGDITEISIAITNLDNDKLTNKNYTPSDVGKVITVNNDGNLVPLPTQQTGIQFVNQNNYKSILTPTDIAINITEDISVTTVSSYSNGSNFAFRTNPSSSIKKHRILIDLTNGNINNNTWNDMTTVYTVGTSSINWGQTGSYIIIQNTTDTGSIRTTLDNYLRNAIADRYLYRGNSNYEQRIYLADSLTNPTKLICYRTITFPSTKPESNKWYPSSYITLQDNSQIWILSKNSVGTSVSLTGTWYFMGVSSSNSDFWIGGSNYLYVPTITGIKATSEPTPSDCYIVYDN